MAAKEAGRRPGHLGAVEADADGGEGDGDETFGDLEPRGTGTSSIVDTVAGWQLLVKRDWCPARDRY